MENLDGAAAPNASGRVTRSLRKRLVSIDSDASSSRPGTPVMPKLTAITESSDNARQQPVRMTRRNSITSAVSTPSKTSRSAALRAETPDLISSPARRSVRKRSISVTEEEHSYAANATKASAVKAKQQQFDALLEEETIDPNSLAAKRVTRSYSRSPLQPSPSTAADASAVESNDKSNSNTPKSASNRSSKKRKPGPKSRAKILDESRAKNVEDNFDSDTIEVINLETEDEDTSSSKQIFMVLIDESIVENNKGENIVEPEHKGTHDKNEVEIDKTAKVLSESIPEQSTVATKETRNDSTIKQENQIVDVKERNAGNINNNNSSKDISASNSKHEKINKTGELFFEGSETTRDASETQTSPSLANVEKYNAPVIKITRIQKLDNLTPETMFKLKSSPFKNEHESPNRKSVAFNRSDNENVVKNTYPRTPGLTKSKSYIDIDSSKETLDYSHHSDKGSVSSFKDAQGNIDEEFIPETQEVDQEQRDQSSKGSGLDFLDATDAEEAADDVYNINPLIQRLAVEDICDDNPLSEKNTPHKVPKLLKNLQSSTPLLDAATKQLKKPTEVEIKAAEEQDKLQVSFDSPEKSLRSGKRYGESPNSSLKKISPKALNKSAEQVEEVSPKNSVESLKVIEETEFVETAAKPASNDVLFSTVTEDPFNSEVDQETQESSTASPFARSWTQSISGKADKNTSKKIDSIVPVDSFSAKNTESDAAKQVNIEPEQSAKLGSKRNSPLASEDHEQGEETVPTDDDEETLRTDNDEDNDEDEEEEGQQDDLLDFIVEEKRYLRKEKPYKKHAFCNDEAMEAADDYKSGDSMDEEERREMEENQISEEGESIGSKDSDVDGFDNDVTDDSHTKFIVSETEEDAQLLEYSDDDEHMEIDNAKKNNAGDKSKKNVFRKRITSDSDDDIEFEAVETNTPKEKGVNKRIQKITSDSETEVVDLNTPKEKGVHKKDQHHKDDTSQPLVLEVTRMIDDTLEDDDDGLNVTEASASVLFVEDEEEEETSKKLNSAKKAEKIKKRKSSLQSIDTNEQLNSSSSSCRKSVNKSTIVAPTDEIDNEATLHTRPSTSSASRRQSLRRSDAEVVDSKDSDDVQNKSLKSIGQHSKIGEESALQAAADDNDTVEEEFISLVVEESAVEKSKSKRASLNQSRLETHRKCSLNESKLKETSDEEKDIDDGEEEGKVEENNDSKVNESKRESLSQGRIKKRRQSTLNDSQLNCKDKQESSEEEEDQLVEEKNYTEINKSKRASLNQSCVKEPRKSMLKESKLNISKAEQENGEKEDNDDDDDVTEEASDLRRKALRKFLNSHNKTETNAEGTVKEKSNRASLQRSIAVFKERSLSSAAGDDDSDANQGQKQKLTKRTPQKLTKAAAAGLSVSFGQIKASKKENPKNLHSSFTIGVSVTKKYTDPKLVDPDVTQSSSEPELENEQEESEDDTAAQAKFSSDDENQKKLEKLTAHFASSKSKSRRQSLAFPLASLDDIAANASSSTLTTKKSKRHSICAPSADLNDSNDDVVVFNPSQSFVAAIDERRRELQAQKIKRKRLSKSLCGDSMTTLDNTVNDDVRHLHKKSKIVKERTDEAKLEVEDRNKKQGASTQQQTHAKQSSSSSEGTDIVRILGRCEEILEAANRAKLEAKVNYQKSLVRVLKKSRKRARTTTNAQETEMEKDVSLDKEEISAPLAVGQKSPEQRKENAKLALAKAFKTSIDILTAPPLGKKKNKVLPKINEDKHAHKCLPPQVLEALSSRDEELQPSVPKKKKKQATVAESHNHDEQENLTHGPHHHRLKSNAGNIIEAPLTAEKRKTKKKTHVRKFELSTGTVSVEPATPARKHSTVSGFHESPLTPRTVGFKVRQILTAGQDAPPPLLSSSMRRKRKRHIEEPKHTLPKPQWTQSGLFIEEKLNGGAVRKIKTGDAINANALNFKQMQMFRDNIPRESARALLQRKQRGCSHNQF